MLAQTKSPTTHVIFDFNGTITNVKSTIINIMTLFGERVNKNAILSQLNEVQEVDKIDDVIKIFYKALESPSSVDYKEFSQEFMARFFEVEFPLVLGVDKLVKHLYKNKIPMAIATNNDKKLFKGQLKRTIGLDMTLISHYVCGADDPEVKARKPAPDVYLVCAKRFDPAPKSLDNCVIFEDSLRGITGAVNTGMKTVLINEQPIVKSDEIANKITVIVDSFDNFKPESVGLPPY